MLTGEGRDRRKGPRSQEVVLHFPPTCSSLEEPISKELGMKMEEREGEATWEPGQLSRDPQGMCSEGRGWGGWSVRSREHRGTYLSAPPPICHIFLTTFLAFTIYVYFLAIIYYYSFFFFKESTRTVFFSFFFFNLFLFIYF